MKKCKFEIDDIVYFKDEYGFNPCEKTTTIGKIVNIYIREGKELGYNPRERNSPKKLNDILYNIAGFNSIMSEHKLKLYK